MKLNKILQAALASTTIVGSSLAAASITSCSTKDKQEEVVESKYFDVQDGVLRGFKSDLTTEQKKEAVKDGVLRLPKCKVIGANAFNQQVDPAPYADKIIIPAEVTEIQERAFFGNKATNITFEGTSNVNFIGQQAFGFCSNLEAFKFPANLFKGEIGEEAFFCCENLKVLDLTAFDHTYIEKPNWARSAFRGLSTSTSGCKVIFTEPSETAGSREYNLKMYLCAHMYTRLNYDGMGTNFQEYWNGQTNPWDPQIKAVPTEYLDIDDNGVLNGATSEWTDRGYNTVLVPYSVKSLGSSINSFLKERSRTSDTGQTNDGIECWLFNWSQITAIPNNACQYITIATGYPVAAYWPEKNEDLGIEGIKTIGDNAFDGCQWINDFPNQASVTSIGQYAFQNSALTGWKFGTGATGVADRAFYGATVVKSLDFSDYGDTLPTWSTDYKNIFTQCGSSVVVGEQRTVTIDSTGNLVDQWRRKEKFREYLKNADLDVWTAERTNPNWVFQPTGYVSMENLFNIQDGVLKGWATGSTGELTKDEVTLILSQLEGGFDGTLVIPASVTTINENAFYDETNQVSKLPDNVTSIKLADGTNKVAINNYAFRKSINLKSFDFSRVNAVRAYAFDGSGLTSIALNRNIGTLNANSFINCQSLETIDMTAFGNTFTKPSGWTNGSVFTGIKTSGKILVTEITNQLDQWRLNYPIKTLFKSYDITFGDDNWKFDHADNATLVTMDDTTVTGWASGATTAITDEEKPLLAVDKYGVSELVIPASATSIAANAFYTAGSSSIPSTLTAISFESGSVCTEIGENAFRDAWYETGSSAQTIKLENATQLTTIGAYAFHNSQISTVTFVSSETNATSPITTFGEGAFDGTTMTTIAMPVFAADTVTFGQGTFSNNEQLATIDMTAYGADAPTNWGSETKLFDNIAESGTRTIKVNGATEGVFKDFLATLSNTIRKDAASWTEVGTKKFDDIPWTDVVDAVTTFEGSEQTEADMKTLCAAFGVAYIDNPSNEDIGVEGHLYNLIGKTHNVTINGLEHTVRIVGINHDTIAEGTYKDKKATFTFESVSLLSCGDSTRTNSYRRPVTIAWNGVSSGTGNYYYDSGLLYQSLNNAAGTTSTFKDNEDNDYVTESVYSQLSSSIGSGVIKKVTKQVGRGSSTEKTVGSYTCYCFTPTMTEFGQTPSEKEYTADEGTSYKYWSENNTNDARKKWGVGYKDVDNPYSYWMATPRSNYTDVYYCNSQGQFSTTHNSVSEAINFAFCI